MLRSDWRLRYPGVDLPFGTIDSGLVLASAPEVGTPDIETDDTVRPRADGVAFGIDYLGGQTVTFELTVDGADEAEVRARLSPLAKAWRADAIRRTPGAVAELVSANGRVAYGRPRRFAPGEELVHEGLIDVTADFASAESVWYASSAGTAALSISPATTGGFSVPLVSPITTSASSNRSAAITVGGEVRTWPVIEIEGPITDPVVEVLGSFRLAFRLSLAFDERLVIDTRPWARTVLRNGSSARGALTRTSTRLSEAAIEPGTHELALRGISATGTARASVTWRDAYLTP